MNDLNQARQHLRQGNLDEAATICLQHLDIDPWHDKALNVLGMIRCRQNAFAESIMLLRQSLTLHDDGSGETENNLAIVLKADGQIDEAIYVLRRATEKNCAFGIALQNLATMLAESGRMQQAIDPLKKLIELEPDNPNNHAFLAGVYQSIGESQKAVDCYQQAMQLQSDDPAGQHALNLATIFLEQNQLQKAVDLAQGVIDKHPDSARGYHVVGIAQHQMGQIDAAINSFQHALKLDPKSASSINNLGKLFHEQNRLDEAAQIYEHGIKADPVATRSHSNLGIINLLRGRVDDAAHNFSAGVLADETYWITYGGLGVALSILAHEQKSDDGQNELVKSWLQPLKEQFPDSVRPYWLQYEFDLMAGQTSTESREKLSYKIARQDTTVRFNSPGRSPVDPLEKSVKPDMICLLHFGRSGSGWLHAILDDHPELSTLPGSYFKGFFHEDVWPKLAHANRHQMINAFCELYPVLFDANHPKGVPSGIGATDPNPGYSEGFTQMGAERDQVLTLDQKTFRKKLFDQLNQVDEINQGDFFIALHHAFEETRGRSLEDRKIFYHIHNPTRYAILNQRRFFPKTRWIVIVRDPLPSAESWLAGSPNEKDLFFNASQKLCDMLFTIDHDALVEANTVFAPLEWLTKPDHKTQQTLCRWMGIRDHDTLSRPTMQGVDWPGDIKTYRTTLRPVSWSDDDPLKRSQGYLFSERDQKILATLFYPMRVQCGYVEADPDRFKQDLKTIRPWLDQPFDFEKEVYKRAFGETETLARHGNRRHLRAVLLSRWQTLSRFGGYPTLIPTLDETEVGP